MSGSSQAEGEQVDDVDVVDADDRVRVADAEVHDRTSRVAADASQPAGASMGCTGPMSTLASMVSARSVANSSTGAVRRR